MHYESTSTFFLLLHAHARGHSESGGDGGEHGNYDVQDFTPDFFVVHGFLFLMFFCTTEGTEFFFVFICHPDDRREEGSRVIHWRFIANGTSPVPPS